MQGLLLIDADGFVVSVCQGVKRKLYSQFVSFVLGVYPGNVYKVGDVFVIDDLRHLKLFACRHERHYIID